MKRVAVAAFFLPLFYFLATFRNPVFFFIFVLLVSSVGLLEFYRLFFKTGKMTVIFTGELLSFFLLIAFYLQGIDLKGLEKMSNPFFLSSIL